MTRTSLVRIAIMTSFHGTAVKKHLAAKGIKIRTGAEAAAYSGCLRVATASKPFALDTLKLRNGKGMKRDCSYVSIRRTYQISLRALAFYGGQKEDVDVYCLTAHSTAKLIEAIKGYKEKEQGKLRRAILEGDKRIRKKEPYVPKKRKASLIEKMVFKRPNWKGTNLAEGKRESIEVSPLTSPREGMRPRWATKEGKILVSPRLISENPYRVLNPRAY